MAKHLTGDDIQVDRVGFATIYHTRDVSKDAVLDALRQPGEPLKTSRKSSTRRVEEWVIKESRRDNGLEILKHTLYRNRYRQGWVAARFLARHGIRLPAPRAFVEIGALGVIAGNALISEYLHGCRTVEHHARQLATRAAGDQEIQAFLFGLADAINALCATGAYHSDLSGKNIFTPDGTMFYFIDLDGMVLNRTYTNSLRLKNHVQLYDSFCDLWGDEFLEPFLARMLPAGNDGQAWMGTVRQTQSHRRARTMGYRKGDKA